jgi:hypothetical protein
VDGAWKAENPLAEPLLLPPGKHEVELISTFQKPYRVTVTIVSGKPTRIVPWKNLEAPAEDP